MESRVLPTPCVGPVSFRRGLVIVLLALALSIGSAPLPVAQAQDEEAPPERFVQWAYRDAGALLLDAGAQFPLMLFWGAPSLGAASLVDAPLLEAIQAEERAPAAYLEGVNVLGDSGMLPATAGLFAVSLLTDDQRFQDAAFTSFQSVLYARLLTGALKGTVGRVRPEDTAGAHQFMPFSGHRSFPSGHATTAFAALTPWILYYPHTATYGLFALGTGTAVARIAFDKHWPTDVLAGAAIGFFTARYLTKRHQAVIAGGSEDGYGITLGPIKGLASAGLGLHARIDLGQQEEQPFARAMRFAVGPALEAGDLGFRVQLRLP